MMRLFLYFSEILGKKIVDVNHQSAGRLYDLCMHLNEEVFPRAERVVIEKGIFFKKYTSVPVGDVDRHSGVIEIKSLCGNLKYQKQPPYCEFSLRRDILDQQVVDTDDQKVVRVNDIHLLRVDGQLYLAHVDVSMRGLVRRLGWTALIDQSVKIFSPKSPYLTQEELISWKHTQVLSIGSKNVLKSTVARDKLSKIPVAELADIMEDLDMFEKLSLFKTFNVQMQRQIFTDLAPAEKAELIEQLDDQEAGSLLENIPADEATDLLHDLPSEKRMQLLRFMHSKTSKQLRQLLGFEQDSAGGLMTLEYLSLKENATVEDALNLIKKNTNFSGNIFFVYILDDANHLIGATSLRQFINEDPKKLLIETCYSQNVFVKTDDGMEEIALLLEKFKFSSIPVLDENDVMRGVITSDDVMEELIGLAWKKYKDQL